MHHSVYDISMKGGVASDDAVVKKVIHLFSSQYVSFFSDIRFSVYSQTAVVAYIYLFVISPTFVYQPFREFPLIIDISLSLVNHLFSLLYRPCYLLVLRSVYCKTMLLYVNTPVE